MNIANLILRIDQVVGLVQMGWASGKAIVDAVKAGHMTVHDMEGNVMDAAVVREHVAVATAKSLDTGDKAGGRIEGRHANG